MTGKPRVVVLGAGGFVGSAVTAALQRRGMLVEPVVAPRLRSDATSLDELRADLEGREAAHARAVLLDSLAGASAVVNAAGIATAAAGRDDALVGANALLPALVAEATPTDARLVHVSSAAVQGRRPVLDESVELTPFSPYSSSKAWGEALLRERAPRATSVRPTSVHGLGRSVTRTLVRVLASPAASVAGAGDDPTPQVLVANVGDAVAHVTTTPEQPPQVVLQPWEGLTTAGLVRLLGGREPRHLPVPLARAVVRTAHSWGRAVPAMAGVARRVEMLWFGQGQERGWLDGRWTPPLGLDGWEELR